MGDNNDVFQNEQRAFILVDSSVLPEVFEKVIEAKRLISSGECSSTTQATKMVSISRSAYYKYKDFVFPYYSDEEQSVITIQATLKDNPGILSAVLTYFADVKANILTVNQNIPVNHMAQVSVSARINHMIGSVNELIISLSKISGVLNVDLAISKQEK